MLNLLISKFLEKENIDENEKRDKLIKISGILGLFINFTLFGIKLFAGIFSNSISIITDSINNITDAINSLLTIFGAVLSGKPADEDHPYGHGRVEYIVTIFISIVILVVGLKLLVDSVKVLLNPTILKFSWITISILIVSILCKIYMYHYNNKIYKITKSLVNKGIAKDALNDTLATTLTLLSIIIFNYTRYNLDGFIGIFISTLVIKTGIELFNESGNILLGKEIEESKIEKMKEIILSGKYIRGVHRIEVHEYGQGKLFGTAHVETPANIDVYSMHKIVSDVEKKIKKELNIKLSIHVDPRYILEKDHVMTHEEKENFKDKYTQV